VEDLLFFPSGAVLLTAGGNSVQAFDLLSAGAPVAKLQSHHKAVTCLAFADGHSQFLSGSIDTHVKVYSSRTMTVAHSLDYASPILSLGVSVSVTEA
jgi:U3 small nucleolar RNA-associated protein 15